MRNADKMQVSLNISGMRRRFDVRLKRWLQLAAAVMDSYIEKAA